MVIVGKGDGKDRRGEKAKAKEQGHATTKPLDIKIVNSW